MTVVTGSLINVPQNVSRHLVLHNLEGPDKYIRVHTYTTVLLLYILSSASLWAIIVKNSLIDSLFVYYIIMKCLIKDKQKVPQLSTG